MTHLRCELANYHEIITVSETWLSNMDNSINFQLNGYQELFRRDRLIGAQCYGGVLAWVADSVACKRRHDFESPDIESMWLQCVLIITNFIHVWFTVQSPTQTIVFQKYYKNK